MQNSGVSSPGIREITWSEIDVMANESLSGVQVMVRTSIPILVAVSMSLGGYTTKVRDEKKLLLIL